MKKVKGPVVDRAVYAEGVWRVRQQKPGQDSWAQTWMMGRMWTRVHGRNGLYTAPEKADAWLVSLRTERSVKFEPRKGARKKQGTSQRDGRIFKNLSAANQWRQWDDGGDFRTEIKCYCFPWKCPSLARRWERKHPPVSCFFCFQATS